MWIVSDSGSTKADWVCVNKAGQQIATSTMGFNPYFHTPEIVSKELLQGAFAKTIPVQEVSKVYFYGAGCSDDKYCSSMESGLKIVFPNAKIEVEHDLLGAARATCGKKPGISGILGTGSNSCAYDGNQVTDNVTALSHVLGDEGSGVHLGKLLLQAYFYRELPSDLQTAFEIAYPEGKRAIIHRIYGENQNVHIAHFAQFVIKNHEHPAMKSIIHQAFGEFARRHLKKYLDWQTLEINLVGSIAEMLKDDLKLVFAKEGLHLGKIIRKPIDNLVEFHRS